MYFSGIAWTPYDQIILIRQSDWLEVDKGQLGVENPSKTNGYKAFIVVAWLFLILDCYVLSPSRYGSKHILGV